VTDSKLYCFLVATRERCRHDFVIRLRGHKLILYLVSTVSQTMETMEMLPYKKGGSVAHSFNCSSRTVDMRLADALVT